MSRTGDLYMMSRLSYEQAIDDYENKKSNSLLESYKKHYKNNVGMDCLDPQGDLIMFYDEDNSQQSLIWSKAYNSFFGALWQLWQYQLYL